MVASYELATDQIAFFGPVSLVFRVADEDEAVDVANASRFGLGGSVFTRDTARGERIARCVETGIVFVNHPSMVKSDIPFGGVKVSGYGNELTDAVEYFVGPVVEY